MLEVFSRDRNTDFEFFEFTDDEIKYKTKDVYDIDPQTKTIYRSLGNGTIILNGIPITIDNVSEEQIEYINNIVELHKEKYKIFKENYKPRFAKYTFGNDIADIVTNTTVIEVPDPRHFKEWTQIKGFEYLQHFLDEYKKQNNKGIKVRKNDMNPVSWTQEKRGFYMSKLTYEDKINIYILIKKGECQ